MAEKLKKYKYKAIDIDKKKHSGVLLAKNEDELRELLITSNLYLVSSRPVIDKMSTFLSVSGRVKMQEITTFCRQFAIMINSGIDIVETLSTLRTQSFSPLFRKTLSTVYDDIRSGLMLSEAFGRHKKIFPEFFISMTHVGEISGSLGKIMNDLADYYDKDQKIKSKAKSALVYPVTLLILTVLVVVVLFVFVMPQFTGALEKMEVPLPGITKAILAISDFSVTYWKELFLGAVIVIAAIALISRLNKVRYFIDYTKTRLPVINKITSAKISSRFIRGFSTLVASGVNIVTAIDIIGRVLGNRYIEKKYFEARDEIKKGERIAKAFDRHGVFPKMLIQMLNVGENTGNLDTVLEGSSYYFDDLYESRLSRFVTLLEPLIIIFMGIVVATIVLAVFLPMLSMMNTF